MPLETALEPDPMNSDIVIAALRRHVGEWYEKAYGERGSYTRSIEFYASGTAARVDTLLRPLKSAFTAAPPRKVLDVGCGFASISVVLASIWPQSRITANDITDYYYAHGRAAAGELGLGNIDFETREIDGMVSEDEFDFVICCNMLNYLTSRAGMEYALGRLAAATRKGGYIVVHTPHFWSVREPFSQIPLLHFLPMPLKDGIVRTLGKRSTLRDIRLPSLREISTALAVHGCTRLEAEPRMVVVRPLYTHVTAWFRK